MERRQFLMATIFAFLLGPETSRGQTPSGRRRRVGIMMAVAETDAEGPLRLDEFRRALATVGWIDGGDVTIETRWYRGNFALAQTAAKELLDRDMDVVVVNGTPGMEAMRMLGATVPLVFVVVSNPVGAGFVSNLSRPGGNITGFSTFEPEIAGKWLQILRQLVPSMKHVGMLLDPKFIGFNSLWQAVEEIAPQYGVMASPAYASSLEEIEQALADLARKDAPGLIVSPSPVNTVHRERLIQIVNERRIPAIYPFRFYVPIGGLLAYGFSAADQFRRAGNYVGRILRGEKPGDLPVQTPSLFELAINLRTARTMGISVPQSLLIGADDVVE